MPRVVIDLIKLINVLSISYGPLCGRGVFSFLLSKLSNLDGMEEGMGDYTTDPFRSVECKADLEIGGGGKST